MKAVFTSGLAIVLSLGAPASAHRLDEYLEATLISIDKDRVQAELRLVPGIAVFPIVLAGIDTDRDGVISESEQKAYATRVLRDVSLSIEGAPLRPRLISATFPQFDELKQGLGEIRIAFAASLPPTGSKRRLIFENRHQSRIGAYLVNCLVPRDPDIRIVAQNRNYTQSFYQLDYVQTGVPTNIPPWTNRPSWLAMLALLLFGRLVFLFRRRPAAAIF